MKVIILEDEKLAAGRIKELIQKYSTEIEILAMLDSVNGAVKWFENNEHPDLAFFDIQLADGLSFEIFEQTSIKFPVIFTTAYDEFALKAFKVNSVDYLLKPIDYDEFSLAVDKFKSIEQSFTKGNERNLVYDKVLQSLTKEYKKRFVVKIGEHIKSVQVKDVLFFYSSEKISFMHTVENRDLIIDYTLEQIQELIDPEQYFRINRKYIIGIDSIIDIISWSNSRLKVKLRGSDDNDIIVAREKVSQFKKWLDR
jgi:DNA-binding LytR/AlgR family response regulator